VNETKPLPPPNKPLCMYQLANPVTILGAPGANIRRYPPLNSLVLQLFLIDSK